MWTWRIGGAAPDKSTGDEGVSSGLGKRTAPRSTNTPLACYTLAWERDSLTIPLLRRCCDMWTWRIGGAAPEKSRGDEGVSSELGKRTAPRSTNTPCACNTLAWERDSLTIPLLRRCCDMWTWWIGGASHQESTGSEGVSSGLGKRTAPRSSNTPLACNALARERDLVTNSFLHR